MKGIKSNIKNFKTKKSLINNDIIEIDLFNLPINENEKYYYNINNNNDLILFFENCKSRVDVIIDPHNNNKFYPYWEGKK